MDIPTALEHTQQVADLLNNTSDTPAWQDALDAAFLKAAFDHHHPQPYFAGPDGMTYFGFKLPGVGDIAVTNPERELKDIIEWVAGAAILTHDHRVAYVYSPGDVVAFNLYGRTRVDWGGRWSEPPDTEAYRQGGPALIAPPNEEMLPPEAARSLEFYLRLYYRSKPALSHKDPAIATVRLERHTDPDDPSELVVNATHEELGGQEQVKGFLSLVTHNLPRHIANRVISRGSFGDDGDFTPLKNIVLDAGLELAPER